MPVVMMHQVEWFNLPETTLQKDKKSLYERVDTLKFNGEPLPVAYCSDGRNPWRVTATVMAQFLLGHSETPAWFESTATFAKAVQNCYRQRKPKPLGEYEDISTEQRQQHYTDLQVAKKWMYDKTDQHLRTLCRSTQLT